MQAYINVLNTHLVLSIQEASLAGCDLHDARLDSCHDYRQVDLGQGPIVADLASSRRVQHSLQVAHDCLPQAGQPIQGLRLGLCAQPALQGC